MNILLPMYIIGGLLLTGLSIPLMLKKIKPNALYGFRIQQTLDDPEVWYRVNAYSGKWLLAAGLATILVSVGLYFIPGLSLDWYASLCALIVLGLLAIGFIASYRQIARLKAEKQTPPV
jgi:hypothetical protein